MPDQSKLPEEAVERLLVENADLAVEVQRIRRAKDEEELDEAVAEAVRIVGAALSPAVEGKRVAKAERERIVTKLLARNLLTIEIEEAIRGPIAPALDSGREEGDGG